MNELLTPDETAKRLKMARRTIYQWLRDGRLRGVKVGNLWRVPEEAIQELIEKGAWKPGRGQE